MTDQAWPGKNKGREKEDDGFFFNDKLKDDEPKPARLEEVEEKSILDDKPLFTEGQSIFVDDSASHPPKKMRRPQPQASTVPEQQQQQPAAESIRIQCNICRKIMVIPAGYQGKAGKCRKCGNIVKISQIRQQQSRPKHPTTLAESQATEIDCYICGFRFSVAPEKEKTACPQCATVISIDEAQKRNANHGRTPRVRKSSSPRFKSRQARMTVMDVIKTSFEWMREDFISFFLIIAISLATTAITGALQRSWGGQIASHHRKQRRYWELWSGYPGWRLCWDRERWRQRLLANISEGKFVLANVIW